MRREWMDAHLPSWLLGIIDWFPYRLFDVCWAETVRWPAGATSCIRPGSSIAARARPWPWS
jgi:hypothetical protein